MQTISLYDTIYLRKSRSIYKNPKADSSVESRNYLNETKERCSNITLDIINSVVDVARSDGVDLSGHFFGHEFTLSRRSVPTLSVFCTGYRLNLFCSSVSTSCMLVCSPPELKMSNR